MTEPVSIGRLRVDSTLHEFVEREALPGTGIATSRFWAGVESILAEFTPRNRALLARRDELQARIDAWWREHKGQPFDIVAHTAFLTDIGYLQAQPEGVQIDTQGTDPEIATVAGPQLVVPVSNPRYALNAANARWVSLYDALYGTDAILPVDSAVTRLRPGARCQRHRLWPQVPRRDRAAAGRQSCQCRRLFHPGCAAARSVRPMATSRACSIPQGLWAGAEHRRNLLPCCCGTTACTWKSPSTARTASARPTLPASPTSSSRRP